MFGHMNLVFTAILLNILIQSSNVLVNGRVFHCGRDQINRTKDKDLRKLVYFLLEENKACHCALEKLQGKRNTVLRDCKQYYESGIRQNGVYRISPKGTKVQFPVYCDMKNGGWTVLQRRINGAVSFDHGWKKYVSGFGQLKADHWLGLNYIHLLTRSPKRISFEFMMTITKKMATVVYEGFQVDDESDNFRMHVSPKATYNEEMAKHIKNRKGFYYHNGMQFSTKDRDNDADKRACALVHPGAWWYKNCYEIAEIHGRFNNMKFYDGKSRMVSTTEIKIY